MAILNLPFNSTILKQSSITSFGTIINGGLGAAFYILMARFLGPADFGLLFVSITTLTLIADIADLGTNTGLVKFVSANLQSDKDKALRFLKLSLEIKVVSWLVVFVIGFIAAPEIARIIFSKTELTFPLRMVMLGVGGSLLFSFATVALQASQKFFWWSSVNVVTNLLRLLLVFLLMVNSQLNLESSLATFIILPFFGFFLSLFLIPTKQFLSVRHESSVVGVLFNYNRLVAVFVFLAAISSRLDTFLSARLLSNYEVGLYSSANQLTSIIPQIVGAIGTVLAPKFSNISTKEEMVSFLRKSLLMVLSIAGIGLVILPVISLLVPLIYGVSYRGMVPPFIILYLAMLIFLIAVPIHGSILYYFGKPGLFIVISLINLLMISTLGYVLINAFGVIGAALIVLISQLVSFGITTFWVIKKIHAA